MVKMHKLTKGGQTIFPATIYDAVVNPNTRKSLTTELSELENEEIYLKTQIEGSIDKDLITEKYSMDRWHMGLGNKFVCG